MANYRCHLCKARLSVDKLGEHFPACSGKIREASHAMTSEDSEVTESVYEDRRPGFPPNPRRSRKSRRSRRVSKERPKTATLPHPQVLDETLKDKVDMTLTKKDLLAAVKLCQDSDGLAVHANTGTRTATNLARLRRLRQYSSNDETGSSSGSAEHIYLPPKARRTGGKGRLKSVPASRPLTSRLERPSHSDIEVPNIRYHSKPKNSKARAQHKLKTEARKKLFSLPLPTEAILEPCLSCGRTDQPERLHTHRADGVKEGKDKEAGSKVSQGPSHGHHGPGQAQASRTKSPLKETNQANVSSKENGEEGEDRKLNRARGNPLRSLSPKKSSSPEKSIPPVTSELASPLVKRKATKQSEKENEEGLTSNNTKSPRKQQRPIHNKNNNNKPNATSPVRAQKTRDFTVDIFTPKSSEIKADEEEKEKKEVEENKKAGGSSSPDKDSSEEAPGGGRSGAVTVKCHTCAKEFGKASIKFHEPQCERKAKAEEERKQRQKEAEAAEEKPASYMDHIEADQSLNESFNEIWEAHVQQLLPCPLCARTFFPDRLEVHQRSCKGPGRGPKTGTETEKAKLEAGEPPARSLVGSRRGKPPPVPEAKNTKEREIPIQYFISK